MFCSGQGARWSPTQRMPIFARAINRNPRDSRIPPAIKERQPSVCQEERVSTESPEDQSPQVTWGGREGSHRDGHGGQIVPQVGWVTGLQEEGIA